MSGATDVVAVVAAPVDPVPVVQETQNDAGEEAMVVDADQPEETTTQVKSAKKPKAKKASPKKPRKSAVDGDAHPKYSQMINEAIANLKDRQGSSRQAILKYILCNYTVQTDERQVNSHLKMSLRAGVKSGKLRQSKGSGACGSYKLGTEQKPKAKTGEKAAKMTKVKKPKTATTKASPVKAAAKKAKSPKKNAKSPAKAAKSPAKAAKSPAKSPAKSQAKKTKAAKSPKASKKATKSVKKPKTPQRTKEAKAAPVEEPQAAAENQTTAAQDQAPTVQDQAPAAQDQTPAAQDQAPVLNPAKKPAAKKGKVAKAKASA